jgi:hypothetical protein
MFRGLLISLVALAFFATPGLDVAQAESAAKTTTVKSSKSNTSDRTAGGSGKGAVQLNPRPEPPGSAIKKTKKAKN